MIIVYNKRDKTFVGYKDYGVVMGVVNRPRGIVLGSVVKVFEDAEFIFGGMEVVKSSRGGNRGINNLKK